VPENTNKTLLEVMTNANDTIEAVAAAQLSIQNELEKFDRSEKNNSRIAILVLGGLGLLFHFLSLLEQSSPPVHPLLKTLAYIFNQDFLINLAAGFYSASAIFYLLDRVFAKRQENYQKQREFKYKQLRQVELHQQILKDLAALGELSANLIIAEDYTIEKAKSNLKKFEVQTQLAEQTRLLMKTHQFLVEELHSLAYGVQEKSLVGYFEQLILGSEKGALLMGEVIDLINENSERSDTYIKEVETLLNKA
jgi:hypothetical protein